MLGCDRCYWLRLAVIDGWTLLLISFRWFATLHFKFTWLWFILIEHIWACKPFSRIGLGRMWSFHSNKELRFCVVSLLSFICFYFIVVHVCESSPILRIGLGMRNCKHICCCWVLKKKKKKRKSSRKIWTEKKKKKSKKKRKKEKKIKLQQA